MTKKHFTVHYWGGIPGRGEFMRLAFEHCGVHYNDPQKPVPLLSQTGATAHPPHLSPPVLETPEGAFISQTANILNYLAPKLGLDGTDGITDEEQIIVRRAHVNQLVATCVDLVDETHSVHHPISPRLKYEDQKPEAVRRAGEFRDWRIPKFLAYFQLVIKENHQPPADGQTWKHLIGSKMTTADLALYHVLGGLQHAFPNKMNELRHCGDYHDLFALKDGIGSSEKIHAYMQSKRRQNFSQGIFRYYVELDSEAAE